MDQRSVSFTLICGWDPLPGCKKGTFDVRLDTSQNVRTRMRHSYRVGGLVDNHFLQSCCYEGVAWSNACPDVFSYATGSVYGAAECRTETYENCQ